MKSYKIILFILLLTSMTGLSLFKGICAQREKYALEDTLRQNKQALALLENEKRNLLQESDKAKEFEVGLAKENATLKDNLRENAERLTSVDKILTQTQKALRQVISQFGAMQSENVMLKQDKDTLNIKLSELADEVENLKSGLASLIDSKQAITETPLVPQGNRGFLIKDKKPATFNEVKIEVSPLQNNP